MNMEQVGKFPALASKITALFMTLVLAFSGLSAMICTDEAYAVGSGYRYIFTNGFRTMEYNDTARIGSGVYIAPQGSDDSLLSWTSLDPEVATIDSSGTIKTKAEDGFARIEVSSASGLKSTIVIAVPVDINTGSEVKQLVARNNVVKLTEPGQLFHLGATVLPTTATDKTITWTSSDESIVKVSGEKSMQAVAPGTAIITGTTSNGKSCQVKAIVDFSMGEFVETQSVALSAGSLSFTAANQTQRLTASVLPADATNKTVTWTSSDTRVATVSDGLVKAVGNGTATITARTVNGKTATCNVTVSIPAIQPTSVVFGITAATLTSKGATRQLTATVYPSNAANKTLTWSSSNTSVATVSSTGKVTAVGSGTATITARTSNGKTATCRVTVSIPVVQPSSVKINQGAFTLTKKNASKTLSATVSPGNAANKTVTWSSSNTSVAKVTSAGKVTPVKNGTAYITAKTSNGKTAKVKVTVKITYPTRIVINTKAFTLTKKGATKTISKTISPSSASDKTLTWSSSNSKVATVNSSGKVTAVKNGTATIKAKTANGKTASVKVTVKIPVAATSVSLSSANFTLAKKGATKTLRATVSPSNATNKSITWKSSNTKVATVTSSGKVIAVKNGTATITAKTSNGKTAKVTVKVSIAQPAASKAGNDAALARSIFDAYNNYRASKGLKKLAWSASYATLAEKSAKANADRGLGPNGKTLQHRLGGLPANCSDILQYTSYKDSAQSLVNRWSASTGHRKMMQCTTATMAGVSAYKASNGLWYYAIVYNFTGANWGGN